VKFYRESTIMMTARFITFLFSDFLRAY